MAVLPILTYPDRRLTQRCVEIAAVTQDIHDLAADMLETMYAAKGRGLAGPQVGAMVRIFVMDVGWKDGEPTPLVMINPDLLWMADSRVDGAEGCLSLPGITTVVKRATVVRLRWLDLQGELQEDHLTGVSAICAQHEFDHLDGVLTLHRIPPQARAIAEAQYFL